MRVLRHIRCCWQTIAWRLPVWCAADFPLAVAHVHACMHLHACVHAHPPSPSYQVDCVNSGGSAVACAAHDAVYGYVTVVVDTFYPRAVELTALASGPEIAFLAGGNATPSTTCVSFWCRKGTARTRAQARSLTCMYAVVPLPCERHVHVPVC